MLKQLSSPHSQAQPWAVPGLQSLCNGSSPPLRLPHTSPCSGVDPFHMLKGTSALGPQSTSSSSSLCLPSASSSVWFSTFFKPFPRGATILFPQPCAVSGLLELAVLSTGQPRPLLTESTLQPPLPAPCHTHPVHPFNSMIPNSTLSHYRPSVSQPAERGEASTQSCQERLRERCHCTPQALPRPSPLSHLPPSDFHLCKLFIILYLDYLIPLHFKKK